MTASGVAKNSFGVAVIDFFEHIIGQKQTVNMPAPLAWNLAKTVIEIFVVTFEETIIPAIPIGVRRKIQPEQNSISVLEKETACGVRLTSQFGNARGDIDMEIRTAIHQVADPFQIFGVAADVCADKGCVGMSCDHVRERIDDRLE